MGEHTCFNLDSVKTLKPQTELKRSFRWFYTYYSYRETYHRQNLSFKVPLEKFMTGAEIGFWFTGFPNLTKGLKIYAGNFEISTHSQEVGALEISKNLFRIYTKDGFYSPTEVQLEGKKRMNVKDFLNGFHSFENIKIA
jgi:hypothetical protein